MKTEAKDVLNWGNIASLLAVKADDEENQYDRTKINDVFKQLCNVGCCIHAKDLRPGQTVWSPGFLCQERGGAFETILGESAFFFNREDAEKLLKLCMKSRNCTHAELAAIMRTIVGTRESESRSPIFGKLVVKDLRQEVFERIFVDN